MAQKVTVSLQDDLDGGPATETVRFGLAGAEYEIDLSDRNAGTFREQLRPFIEHARRAGRSKTPPNGRASAASRDRTGDIRTWAREHGLEISERGRIPGRVIEQYEAAAKAR